MFNNGILDQIFKNRQEEIENNIHEEYHKRIKMITTEDSEERNNIKMNILSELYYKEGFRDGINFIISNLNNKNFN